MVFLIKYFLNSHNTCRMSRAVCSFFEALILNSVFLLRLESIRLSALLMTLTALFNQNYNMFACCSDRLLRLICISWIS